MKEYKTLLDDDLTDDEVVEGFAVTMCVMTGRCETCSHKPICETDKNAIFPQDAPCMVTKRRMMAAVGGGKP